MNTQRKQQYSEHGLFLVFAILLFLLGSLVCFSVAQAATLGVVVRNAAPEINQPIRVDIPLDTQGADANAIHAQIVFPADQFNLLSVNDGASPVSFWIAPPEEIASGVVAFSGIMPGGFQGAASSVVSLWLLPTTSGAGVISLADVQLLSNDGNATNITTATGTAVISVSATVASSTPTRPVSFIKPEPFIPVISQDPNTFGGKYFLAFSTTDKRSGISYYQVAEVPAGSALGQNPPWTIAVSPYLLQDQTLSSDIYVRAVNNAGGSITVELPAEHPTIERIVETNFTGRLAIAILCVLGLMLIGFAFWMHRRRR